MSLEQQIFGMMTIGAVLNHKTELTKTTKTEEVRTAIRTILNDTKAYQTSLNYAVNYCRYALEISDPEELKVQCLYILNNISHWRGPGSKEIRKTLKDYTK